MINKTIVALDFPDLESTKKFVDKVGSEIEFVKVGMQLFYSEGYKVIEYLKDKNYKIFLDLKLHDIPTTVSKSLKVIDKLNIEMVNVHVLGGYEMLKRAQESLSNTSLLGVTVLTSHDQKEISELSLTKDIASLVCDYHDLAYKAGLSGIVCSAQDLEHFSVKEGFFYVTPGIRLNQNHDDQKRVMKPRDAFDNGSTHIVIGREITTVQDPLGFLDQLKEHYERDC